MKLEYKNKNVLCNKISFQLKLYFILCFVFSTSFNSQVPIWQRRVTYRIGIRMYVRDLWKISSKMNFNSVTEQRKMSAEVRAGRPTIPTIPHSKRPTILVYPTGKDANAMFVILILSWITFKLSFTLLEEVHGDLYHVGIILNSASFILKMRYINWARGLTFN